MEETKVEKNPTKVLTIIMVSRDNLEATQKALRSLSEFTDPADYDLIFFDQSVEPHTQAFVVQFCRDAGINCKFICTSGENWGYVKAVNHCYALVETEYSLTSHDDVVFSKWWLKNMMRKFQDPEVAGVGPVITYALGQQSVNLAYKTLGCKVKFLLGLFFMARQKHINEVKKEFNNDEFWLNPVYGLGDKEELEFCYLIRELGYKLAIARDVLIEHKGQDTFVKTLGSEQKFREYQDEKLKLLKERLGDDVVDSIYQIEFEKQPKVRLGVITRTSYVHSYFAFCLAGVYGQTPVFKDLHHIPRGHVDFDRNNIIEKTLKDESITHICFIDDDMVFAPDALTKLLMMDVDWCTGVAYQRSKPYMICIFGVDHEKKEIRPFEAIDIGSQPIGACGGYFLLIKTDVLRKMGKPWFKYGDTELGYNDVRNEDGRGGEGIGEDVYFGIKATLAGFKGYVDSDLEIQHIGYEEMVGKKQYWASKESNFEVGESEKTL